MQSSSKFVRTDSDIEQYCQISKTNLPQRILYSYQKYINVKKVPKIQSKIPATISL